MTAISDEVGRKYEVVARGFRVPILSTYQNIIEIKRTLA